jgi:hypothetical protein
MDQDLSVQTFISRVDAFFKQLNQGSEFPKELEVANRVMQHNKFEGQPDFKSALNQAFDPEFVKMLEIAVFAPFLSKQTP